MVGIVAVAEQRRQPVAGKPRHVDVDENEIGLKRPYPVRHAVPIMVGNYFVLVVLQCLPGDIEMHFVIVDDQDLLLYLNRMNFLHDIATSLSEERPVLDEESSRLQNYVQRVLRRVCGRAEMLVDQIFQLGDVPLANVALCAML